VVGGRDGVADGVTGTLLFLHKSVDSEAFLNRLLPP
jgi:hypothetical protein